MSNLRIKFTDTGTVVRELQIEKIYDEEIQIASNGKIEIKKTGYSTKERNDGFITIKNKDGKIIGFGLQECKREATYPNIRYRNTIIRRAFMQIMKYYYNEVNLKHKNKEDFKIFIINTEKIIIPIYYNVIAPYIDKIFKYIEDSFNIYRANHIYTYVPFREYMELLESDEEFMNEILQDAMYIDDKFNMVDFIIKIKNKLNI